MIYQLFLEILLISGSCEILLAKNETKKYGKTWLERLNSFVLGYLQQNWIDQTALGTFSNCPHIWAFLSNPDLTHLNWVSTSSFIQDFPNSVKGWRESKTLLGREFFYWVIGTWGVILTMQTFFKAKNNILLILNIN